MKHGNADALSHITDGIPFCDCYSAGSDLKSLMIVITVSEHTICGSDSVRKLVMLFLSQLS